MTDPRAPLPASLEELTARAEEMAGLLRALSHPARLLILCKLMEAERGVSALEEKTGVRQPGLSRELGKLREAGLISPRREAKAVFYTISDARARALVAALCDLDNPQTLESPVKPADRSCDDEIRASLFARAGTQLAS